MIWRAKRSEASRLLRASVLTAFVAMYLSAVPAAAERLVVSVSNHRVLVNSNFIGEELVLFGTIEPDTPAAFAGRSYNVVVTVTGPRQTLRTRRKDRMLGIWVNTESRLFERVPSYLAVLANRPLSDIASAETLRRLQLGLDNTILMQQTGADAPSQDVFRAAFLRLERDQALYRESGTAVTFLTPTVFRTSIPLPANVPTGSYAVDVQLFAEGTLIARTNSALEIVKAGFEQFVANAARDYGVLYGLATAMMALLTGWFASVVFRRD